jgi:hypothetical protein
MRWEGQGRAPRHTTADGNRLRLRFKEGAKPGWLEAVQREEADAEEAAGRVEAKPDPPSSAGYACG